MCLKEKGKLSVKSDSFFSFSQPHTSTDSNELQIIPLLETVFNSGKEDKYRTRNFGSFMEGKSLLFTPPVSSSSIMFSIE